MRKAARLFGIGRHLLFQAAERGELDVFDPGGWSRVRVSDVEAWIERTRRVPRVAP